MGYCFKSKFLWILTDNITSYLVIEYQMFHYKDTYNINFAISSGFATEFFWMLRLSICNTMNSSMYIVRIFVF